MRDAKDEYIAILEEENNRLKEKIEYLLDDILDKEKRIKRLGIGMRNEENLCNRWKEDYFKQLEKEKENTLKMKEKFEVEKQKAVEEVRSFYEKYYVCKEGVGIEIEKEEYNFFDDVRRKSKKKD